VRRNVEGAVIISKKKVKHRVAGTCSHAFDKLVNEWGYSSVADGDAIKGPKVMDNAEGAILLLDTKPV